MPEEDIYDAVYYEDEQEIYDDLCSLKLKPPQVQDRTRQVVYCWKPTVSSLSFWANKCIEMYAKETSRKRSSLFQLFWFWQLVNEFKNLFVFIKLIQIRHFALWTSSCVCTFVLFSFAFVIFRGDKHSQHRRSVPAPEWQRLCARMHKKMSCPCITYWYVWYLRHIQWFKKLSRILLIEIDGQNKD